MTAPIMEGCEPYSATGSNGDGALVVHGFTGNPQSMRPLAEAFAAAGFTVELPLLPGHGTSLDDMLPTRFEDWSGAAEAAYTELASRCRRVVVAGLSMGGTLTAWLATRHPEIAGIVVVNGAFDPPADSFGEMLQSMLETSPTMPGIGSDVADPAVTEQAYEATPIAALLSLFGAVAAIKADLPKITCPVLIYTSTQDHVVAPVSSDVLAEGVSGPVERVTLERSYHVATIDYDKDIINEGAVAFAQKVCAA